MMKIKIGRRSPEGQSTTLTVGTMHEVWITECYLGIAIKTDQGVFGIAQRDDGIEVMLDGKFAWTSMDMKRDKPSPVPDDEGFLDKAGSLRMEKFLKTRSGQTVSKPPPRSARND